MRSQLNIYPSSCIKRTCHNILDEDQQNNRDPTHYNVFSFAPESYNLNKLRLNGTKN